MRKPDSLQRVLLDPAGAMIPGNRSVRAVTRDGRMLRGRRLNEDAYTIQLIDEQSRLVSLVKADLRSFDVSPTSSMPSFETTLTADERADLIAYLLSLKGALAMKKSACVGNWECWCWRRRTVSTRRSTYDRDPARGRRAQNWLT